MYQLKTLIFLRSNWLQNNRCSSLQQNADTRETRNCAKSIVQLLFFIHLCLRTIWRILSQWFLNRQLWICRGLSNWNFKPNKYGPFNLWQEIFWLLDCSVLVAIRLVWWNLFRLLMYQLDTKMSNSQIVFRHFVTYSGSCQLFIFLESFVQRFRRCAATPRARRGFFLAH